MIQWVCLLLLLSALVSASETALFSLPRSKIDLFERGANQSAKMIAHLLKSPKNLLITFLMINISVNITIQNVFSAYFNGTHWFFTLLCPLCLTLILGEILPKSIALCMNEKIARFMSPILIVVRFFLMPLRLLFSFLSNFVMKLVSLKSKAMASDEKIFALEKSAALGLISEDESTILRGAASLSDIKVKEIMRLKDQMICYSVDKSIESLIKMFRQLECSKIVVFDGQKPLGILHQETFFKHQDEIVEAKDLEQYLVVPFYVVDSFNCKRVLEMMRGEDVRIALVIDEYSSVIGLVTKEDLIERIVGQIYDKRDEKKLYTKQKDGSLICSGKLQVKELEELMEQRIDGDYESTTIGGILTQIQGDLPKIGSRIGLKKLSFVILGVDEKRVKSLHVFRS